MLSMVQTHGPIGLASSALFCAGRYRSQYIKVLRVLMPNNPPPPI